MDPPELPVAQLVRLAGPVRDQREPGAGGAEPHGRGRGGHLRRVRALPPGGPPGGTPVTPVGQPLGRHDALRRPVAAGRGDDDRQHGRRPRRPTACPGLRPAGRAARGGLDAARQRRGAAARLPGRGRRAHDGPAGRPARAGAAAVGPAGVVGPGAPAARGPRRAGPRRARGPGARLRAVGRRAAAPAGGPVAARRAPARRMARAPSCAPPTTSGTRGTGRRCGSGAGAAEQTRSLNVAPCPTSARR